MHFGIESHRKMWSVTLCFILSALCLSRAQDSNTGLNTQVAESISCFSVDLLKVVFGATDGNSVISPVSVSTLLALVQQGSGGNTEVQLTQVLHLNPQQSKQGYSQLTRNLKQSSGNVYLEFASAVFLKQGYEVNAQFENTLQQDFQSTIQPSNFEDALYAAFQINSWVESKVHMCTSPQGTMIAENLVPDSKSYRHILVLFNAIYFKGLWKTPFEKRNTRNDNFFVLPNAPKLVPTLHLQAKLLTGNLDELNSRWLRLPFEGDRFYLLIILPNAKDGVQSLVNSITGPEVFDLIKNLESRGSSQEVVLSLPKFKLQTTVEFGPFLQEMGLADIFSRQSNLSGISQQPLLVFQVGQKALLEVDEEGATAATAKGMQAVPQSVDFELSRPVYFTVDHPFLAFLVDGVNNLPLFSSRVSDPATS